MSKENTIKFDIGQFVAQHVASHLSVWLLKTKDVTVSVDELMAALGMQNMSATGGKQPVKTAASVPAYFKEPSVKGKKSSTGKSKSKAKGKEKEKEKEKEGNGDLCSYTFTRGKHVGDQCGKGVAGPAYKGGDKYCKGCLNKKAVNEILTNGDSEKDIVRAPTVKTIAPTNNSSDETVVEWQVDRYVDDKPGIMFHTETGFVLKLTSGGEPVAIGKDPLKTGTWTPLTEEEEEKAIGMGLSVQSKEEETAPPEEISDIAQL